ncbi:macrolide family glycosyltransferase [Streptomyces sp. NPDC021212]|uniref:macrolide family glycosyltransferase n=1 Tax=Streptomyces sp. NPDC021212 TaxID=3365118 RepID=UPI0037ACBAD2
MTHRVLMLGLPAFGHVIPSLATAAELVRRGSEVTFVTVDAHAERARRMGATVVTYPSLDPVARLQTAGPVQSVMLLLEENALILRAVEAHLAGSGPRPDLVAYDSQAFQAGRVLAARWGLPAVQLEPVFASNEHYSFMREMTEATAAAGPVPTPDELAAYGKRNAELLAEHGVTMPVMELLTKVEDFHVVFVPRAFQPRGETFDERFAFVGPCAPPGGDATAGAGADSPPPWRPPAGDRPVALISLGTTYNNDAGFFRTALRAFEGLGHHLVLALGHGLDPAALGPLPPHAEAHAWITYRDVLRYASVFVTQGGMGSLTEAMHEGCPTVVVPGSASYLPGCRRAAELGLGEVLRPEELNAERLRAAVLRLAGDAELGERLADMRRSTREAGGAMRAAEEITAYLERTTR